MGWGLYGELARAGFDAGGLRGVAGGALLEAQWLGQLRFPGRGVAGCLPLCLQLVDAGIPVQGMGFGSLLQAQHGSGLQAQAFIADLGLCAQLGLQGFRAAIQCELEICQAGYGTIDALVAQLWHLQLCVQVHLAGFAGSSRVLQPLLQLAPAAFPLQFGLGMALQAGTTEQILHAGQLLQPLRQRLHGLDVQLQLALAFGGAGVQFQICLCAGQLGLQLAFDVLGVGVKADAGALQRGLQGLQIQLAHLQLWCLPAAFRTRSTQMQSAALAGVRGLQVQLELHLLAGVAVGLQAARQGGAVQCAVEQCGVDLRKLHLAFKHLAAGIELSLRLYVGRAFGAKVDTRLLQCPLLLAVKLCLCSELAHGQGLLVPWPSQRVFYAGLQCPAIVPGASLQAAVEVSLRPIGQEPGDVDVLQRGICLLQYLGAPGGNGGTDVCLGGCLCRICCRLVF